MHMGISRNQGHESLGVATKRSMLIGVYNAGQCPHPGSGGLSKGVNTGKENGGCYLI